MTDPSQYDDENQVSNDDYPGFDEPVSKSELKRQSAQQQRVGEQLVNLSDAHLKTIPLDDELGDAVALARRINRKKRRLSPSVAVYWKANAQPRSGAD